MGNSLLVCDHDDRFPPAVKLGEDAEVRDDTPLLGGDFDLDSLDVLLLVTSVEKEFGIKIPNEAVSQEAFANVATLARFVEDHVG